MTAPMSSAPARAEFADGWPAVLGAALAIGVGMMGVGFYSLGLFVQPLQAEMGWSRAEVSGAATFQQLGIFLSAPIVGLLADRIGARPIAIASYLATPLVWVALSFAGPSIAGWYALWLLLSLAGCGTTPAIWARVVSVRFDRARGLALGLMLLGTGAAAMLAPMLLGPLVAQSGWRTAALVVAGATALIGLPVSLLMPRGEPVKARRGGGRFDLNRQTAIVALVGVMLGFLVAGLIVHLVPLLVDRGMGAAEAAQFAGAIGAAVIVARVVVGYLFDRLHAPYIAALFLVSPIVSALLLLWGGPVLLAALLLGLAAGAEVDMLAYFTGRYARIENYGATYGVILGLFSLGAAFGPMAFGRSVDLTGNYDWALAASAAALAVVVVLIATLGPYRHGSDGD
ncbi:MFS transporter [Croceicoccus sp. BE223]|uniref:MFS transporter n=1 Tax=Croceicoccus sp. BE223 TaxID=2817716 RepID=UPI00285A6475|nr:MFS transporter [Croceicoccus sp. BE223]MDR7104097.1 MFS family permease [Croceicoccus sp. BE223]